MQSGMDPKSAEHSQVSLVAALTSGMELQPWHCCRIQHWWGQLERGTAESCITISYAMKTDPLGGFGA